MNIEDILNDVVNSLSGEGYNTTHSDDRVSLSNEDFLNELANSLSGRGYNTTINYDWDRVSLSNEEMKCSVELSTDFGDDVVLLSDIFTKNCYIEPYEDSFIIDDYDSVEELADEILEVVDSYSGTEAKQQKFIKDFIKSMNRHGCSGVKADFYHIYFTYKGIEWMIDPDYSQAPDGIWCFKRIFSFSSYLTSEQLKAEESFPSDLELDLEKWDVKRLVESILEYIDSYILKIEELKNK